MANSTCTFILFTCVFNFIFFNFNYTSLSMVNNMFFFFIFQVMMVASGGWWWILVIKVNLWYFYWWWLCSSLIIQFKTHKTKKNQQGAKMEYKTQFCLSLHFRINFLILRVHNLLQIALTIYFTKPLQV